MSRSALLRALLLVALLLAVGVAPVAAVNDSPDGATVLTAAANKGYGTLSGNGGGTFRYFRFAYGGASAFVTINLTWTGGWGLTDAAFGFNLYGPSGHVGEGTHIEDKDGNSTRALTFSSGQPGDYLIQVYNYTVDATSDFTVEVIGLPTAALEVTGNTAPEGAVRASGSTFTATGTILGSGGGAFNYYQVEYPGGDSALRFSLSVWPSPWLEQGGYGFNVWDGSTLLVSGEETSRDEASATKTAFIQRMAPGVFVVQVYNYVEGVTADYTLGVTGAAGTVGNGVGNNTPEQALLLTPSQAAYHGFLPGNGSFAYYGFNYPGGSRSVQLVLSFRPGLGITATGVGYNVYRGSDLVMSGKVAEGSDATNGIATGTFNFEESGLYIVQVYNYVADTTAEYAFYAVGLP